MIAPDFSCLAKPLAKAEYGRLAHLVFFTYSSVYCPSATQVPKTPSFDT